MPDGNDEVLTRLLLVRHGESVAQVERIVGGDRGCRGLSDLGRRQIEALRDRWKATGMAADRLFASNLPRAIETAEILSPAVGGLEVEVESDLAELRPGETDALSWDEYTSRYGFNFAAHPYRPLSPGGESMASFLLRVGQTLHRIAREHRGETLVLAVHGGIVDGSLSIFLGLPTQRTSSFALRTTNSSITEWAVQGEPDEPLHWHLARYNDAAHLESLPPA